MSRLPIGRLSLLVPLSGAYLAVSALLRLVLWWKFGPAAQVGLAEMGPILLFGLVNDLIALLYVNAPAACYLLLVPGRLLRAPWHRRLVAVGVFATLFAMLYLGAAEYFFFEEFDSRFNLVAVDYLIYPHEVLVNIWDSYPVLPVVLADLAVAGLLFRRLWPMVKQSLAAPQRFADRLKLIGVYALILSLAAVRFSTDSFAFSSNRVSNQLACNGISSLFRAFRTNELSYDAFYRTLDHERAFRLVRENLSADGDGFNSPQLEDLDRSHAARPEGLGRMNVVVIVEESLSAKYVGVYGDGSDLTPNFDRLSRAGLLFDHAYATGTRTVRGLEAITTSLPPIPSESILKRPGSEGIANWGEVMRENGYRTSFLYGGYGYFDNMNHFYQSNGFSISDRTEIPQPRFANIWGVSDEDLFDHAMDYFDGIHGQGEPFFSIIMTTSNHKPFTFPSGVEGIPAKGGGRRDGVRYADYALGRFFDQSPVHPWFENTLFVIVADHCARVYGRAQVPVRNYEIPLLLYAPGRLAAGRIETATSQIDIAPTVLGLLGLPYTAPFYGRDVLAERAGSGRPIMLNHNHDVALFQDERLVVLGLNRQAQVFDYDREQNRQLPAADDPALVDLATAYYQTAFELFKAHRYQ
ncbi:sulfatase [Desulfuromonas versatilis]|uniref:Sulfatase n=2 Tax=Desulfuromonas versatilis TaxID=2802975 RepID=A0ABN6E1W6_9BACT|nr:sulfatase [Desulfuromonas versatilis]